MTKLKIAFSIGAFFAVSLFGLTDCFAQAATQKNQVEPSYDVILQTVIGSNNTGIKTDIPPTLSDLSKKMKANYSYSNYRLASTFLQRVANTGSVDFRGVVNETSSSPEKSYTSFIEWTLNNLQSLPNAKGQNSVQFQGFRFGQRIPIVSSTVKDENGKINSVVTYEQVGLTLQKFSLTENTPTLVGTLSTSKPDELMFLILTVRAAEE